jgi:hypothetical protein
MKIICKDNYDREHVSDTLVCENVNEYYANHITKLLNEKEGDHSPDYYRAVPDDHKLYKFEP